MKCAIYTRKSSEEGLEQSFNSLHAQREACEAYIKSQRHEGWLALPRQYDDGGFSGGTMERPALIRLIDDIKLGNVNIIVVYKVDRLSRSLADFVRLIELCDEYNVSFVSVTQQFNTSTSMGRLTLNVLLSFAQFEREVTGERIRDKIAASKQKGMWMGGVPPIGYDVEDKCLIVNKEEAITVQHIHNRYLILGCVRKLKAELDEQGYSSRIRQTKNGITGGNSFSRGALYTILKNPLYLGKVAHKGCLYDGQHSAILDKKTWEQVQEHIEMNRIHRSTRQYARNPSLLAGLLFDDNGNPMSPTHASKGSRRYRYYISQAILSFRESDGGSVIRIAANLIEKTVTDEIKRLLRSGHEMLQKVIDRELTATNQKQLIARSRMLADNWDQQGPQEHIQVLQKIIHKIVVGQNRIDIFYIRPAITNALLPDGHTPDLSDGVPADTYQVSVPAQLKRCGIETKLIIPGKEQPGAHERTVRAIQDSLRKALNWNQALITGKAASKAELARNEGVSKWYITQIIKLAYLAPDIMGAIIKGNIPATLTLVRLKEAIPLDWNEQRNLFGFSNTSAT
jgi:DNA invertase Pin-like site-specific DNA recombinase